MKKSTAATSMCMELLKIEKKKNATKSADELTVPESKFKKVLYYIFPSTLPSRWWMEKSEEKPVRILII